MKIVAGEVAEYLYFFLVGTVFLVSSAFYLKHLNEIPTDNIAVIQDEENECPHNLFPASGHPFIKFMTDQVATLDPNGNDTVVADSNLEICADISQWKYFAFLGIVVGALCLLQNPWFKMINCHSGPGRKRARKLTKSSIKSTPGMRQVSKVQPQLGVLIYHKTETDEKEEKDSALKTCFCCLYGCTFLWAAVAYVVALVAIPIYLAINLIITQAPMPLDSSLSTPATVLLITTGVHLLAFTIIMFMCAHTVIVGLCQKKEANIDDEEDALWEEMQRKAKIEATKQSHV